MRSEVNLLMWIVSALTTCLPLALKKEITGVRTKETKVTSILLKIAACVYMQVEEGKQVLNKYHVYWWIHLSSIMSSGSLISVNAIYITANAATRCSLIKTSIYECNHTWISISVCDTNDISNNESHTVWAKVTTETLRVPQSTVNF